MRVKELGARELPHVTNEIRSAEGRITRGRVGIYKGGARESAGIRDGRWHVGRVRLISPRILTPIAALRRQLPLVRHRQPFAPVPRAEVARLLERHVRHRLHFVAGSEARLPSDRIVVATSRPILQPVVVIIAALVELNSMEMI